jgi:hypothetical protein
MTDLTTQQRSYPSRQASSFIDGSAQGNVDQWVITMETH